MNKLIFTLAIFVIICTMSYATQVELSSSDLPYSASAGDTITILGSKISTSGNGIFANAPNVFLDLGTDTLEFGTGYGDGLYGIRMYYLSKNVTINGGTILHGGGTGAADSSWENSCIVLDDGEYITIKNTNAIVKGWNGHCITGDGALKMIEIDGGTYRSDVEGYTSRCGFDGVAIRLGTAANVTGDEYNYKIHDIVVEHTPQAAIRVTGKAFIYNNHLEVDARNDLYTFPTDNICKGTVQSWGIIFRYMDAGSYISNNLITSGSNFLGADGGIILEYCSGTAENPINIFNNVCRLSRGIDQHYGDLTCKGIKYRWSNNYVNIYDNEIYIVTDSDPATTHIGKVAEGFDIIHNVSEGFADSNIVIERNHVEVLALDNGISFAYAIRMAATDGFDWNRAGNRMKDNYLKGSTGGIQLGGESGNAANITIEGGTIANFPISGLEFVTLIPGHYARSCTNLVVIDMKFEGDASPTDIGIWGATAEMTIQQTLNLVAMGSNDFLIGDNVSYQIINNYGDTVLSAPADSGFISKQVSYWYRSNTLSDSTSYNPFRVLATVDGTTESLTLDVDWDTPVIYFNFTEKLGTIDTTGMNFDGEESDNIPPAAIFDLRVSP